MSTGEVNWLKKYLDLFRSRRFAFIALVVLLPGCLEHTDHEKWTGQNWPTYQFRSDHNAVLADNNAPATAHWTSDFTGKVNGGLAYSAGSIFVATLDQQLIALDVKSGAQLWKTNFDNEMMSSPILLDGQVVVGSGANGLTSRSTFAYSDLFSEAVPFWGRPAGDHVVATDASSGQELWSYHTAGEDMPSPVAVNGKVFFANGDAHAYALFLTSGVPVWRTALPGISTMASATAGSSGLLFFSGCRAGLTGFTVGIEAESGTMKWQTPHGDCDSSPTLGDGKLFLSGISGNRMKNGYGGRAEIAAVDPKSGKLLWRHIVQQEGFFSRIGSSERAITGTYVGGIFYVSSPSTDEMLALDGASGHLIWRTRSLGPIKMSPIVYKGKLYVGDTVGLFYAINARTGEVLETRMFAAAFSTSPAIIINESIFVINGTKLFAIPINAVKHDLGS